MSEAAPGQPRVLSLYEGFFNGGARILHTDVVIGLQDQGQPQAVFTINETVHRERTVQTIRRDRCYRSLAAAGIEVMTMGRHSDGVQEAAAYSEEEIRRFKELAAQADIVLVLKEQPLGLINQTELDGQPVITCLHRSDPEADSRALDELVKAVKDGRVDTCICCADSTKAAYQAAGIPESKLHVINNGIDLDRFKPSAETCSRIRREIDVPPAAPVVTLAARYHAIKDVPLFVESAAIYLREQPDGHVVMCGAGMTADNPGLQGLLDRFLADGEEAASRVRFLGIRDDMEAIYAASDIVALTSHREAYPLSLIEGMACGAVPVSTDVGDVAEMLQGRGITTDRDPAAIAQAWQQAYAERDEFRADFAKNPDKFSRVQMITAYTGLINHIHRLHGASSMLQLEH